MHAITLQGQRHKQKLLNTKYRERFYSETAFGIYLLSIHIINLHKYKTFKFTRALYLALGPILSRNVDKIEESMCTVQDHVD